MVIVTFQKGCVPGSHIREVSGSKSHGVPMGRHCLPFLEDLIIKNHLSQGLKGIIGPWGTKGTITFLYVGFSW